MNDNNYITQITKGESYPKQQGGFSTVEFSTAKNTSADAATGNVLTQTTTVRMPAGLGSDGKVMYMDLPATMNFVGYNK